MATKKKRPDQKFCVYNKKHAQCLLVSFFFCIYGKDKMNWNHFFTKLDTSKGRKIEQKVVSAF